MPSDLPLLARRTAAALTDFIRSEEITRAVNCLENHGDASGSLLTYTHEAIAALDNLHRADPDDTTLLHHLAIARHGRAWDWELAEDPRAAAEWAEALRLWRKLQTAPIFWEALSTRLLQLNSKSDDSAWLDRLRTSLLEQLVGIHVDFVCHWTNKGRNDRALSHVAIIRKAQIPPVARMRLIGLVFQFMTGGVADAWSRKDFPGALSALEAFLKLFPDYSPALRQYFEIGHDWMDSLAYATEWAAMESLAIRARPMLDHAVKRAVENSDPLLKPAVLELATQVALNARKRGDSIMPSTIDEGNEEPAILSAIKGYQLGYEFAITLIPLSAPESYLRRWFHDCAVGWADALCSLSVLAIKGEMDRPKALQLLRPALPLLDQAQQAFHSEYVENEKIPEFHSIMDLLTDEY